MKKMYSYLSMFAMMTIIAVVTFYSGTKSANGSGLSEVMLNENIEALTDSEEAIVVCGGREHKGPCWMPGNEMKMCGPYFYIQCVMTGKTIDNCTEPC